MRADLPDTPSNVSVLEESSTWVRLSAEPPRRDGGLSVSHWSVKYEPADTLHAGHSSSRLFTDGTCQSFYEFSSLFNTTPPPHASLAAILAPSAAADFRDKIR